MALATLLAVLLQLNGSLMMGKIHQAKQNDAIRAALFFMLKANGQAPVRAVQCLPN